MNIHKFISEVLSVVEFYFHPPVFGSNIAGIKVVLHASFKSEQFCFCLYSVRVVWIFWSIYGQFSSTVSVMDMILLFWNYIFLKTFAGKLQIKKKRKGIYLQKTRSFSKFLRGIFLLKSNLRLSTGNNNRYNQRLRP